MNNKTYIQEQKYYLKEDVLTEKKIKEDVYGDIYYFDLNNDTSKNSSSEIADSPIDASKGASLQDKRIINMKTASISGKFSSRCTNNSSFKTSDNRLGIIIRYFEDALAKQQIYTVCRKGAMYYNMMLDKVSTKFDEYCSTVEISLSFIEVNFVVIQYEDSKTNLSNAIYTLPEAFNKLTFSDLTISKTYFSKTVDTNPPKLYATAENGNILLAIENTTRVALLDEDWMKEHNLTDYNNVIGLTAEVTITLEYSIAGGPNISETITRDYYNINKDIKVFKLNIIDNFENYKSLKEQDYLNLMRINTITFTAYFLQKSLSQSELVETVFAFNEEEDVSTEDMWLTTSSGETIRFGISFERSSDSVLALEIVY